MRTAPSAPSIRSSGKERKAAGPAVAEQINLSGLWLGSYSYPAGVGPTTPFMAKLVDAGGSLSGEMVEPNTMGISAETLEAFLVGTREGSAIDFTKTYDGAADAAHSIDYVGRVTDDGNRVTGVWSLDGMDGSFEMHREAVWEQAEGKVGEVVEL
jgi:hypothetical protein